MKKNVKHELEPFYHDDSVILILGSMPSIKSKEKGFYYMHPQNRFWPTLANIYKVKLDTIDDKKKFLKKYRIALWDVIDSCDIIGSSDSSINNVVVNDINDLIQKTNIKIIFTTGKKAYYLYQKHCYNQTKIKAIPLPSTSPAYCPQNIKNILVENYSQIKNWTDHYKAN